MSFFIAVVLADFEDNQTPQFPGWLLLENDQWVNITGKAMFRLFSYKQIHIKEC